MLAGHVAFTIISNFKFAFGTVIHQLLKLMVRTIHLGFPELKYLVKLRLGFGRTNSTPTITIDSKRYADILWEFSKVQFPHFIVNAEFKEVVIG